MSESAVAVTEFFHVVMDTHTLFAQSAVDVGSELFFEPHPAASSATASTRTKGREHAAHIDTLPQAVHRRRDVRAQVESLGCIE